MLLPKPQPKIIERPFLVDALERVLDEEGRRRAHAVFEGAISRIPELVRFRITPQTPPYHAEGPNVASHVERILASVLAIEEGMHLNGIEEFAREATLRLAIDDIEETIRSHVGFWKAFALVHDIAKPDLVFFTAPESSKGAAEGFSTYRRSELAASPKEIARFDKLVRAHIAARPKMNDREAAVSCYNEFGVRAHYDLHDRKGAGPEYAAMRAAALELFGVDPSFHKLLSELMWSHIDALNYFTTTADSKKYESLAARARKMGLNADVFLTFLAAGVLLDGVFGSLVYDAGKLAPNPAPFLNLLHAELEAVPLRNAGRLAAVERAEKQAIRDILAEAKLSPADVFALVPAPMGPVRGEIMRAVTDLVRGHEPGYDFGRRLGELRERASMARKMLEEKGLSL